MKISRNKPFSVNVQVPYHITQATLVDPDRVALSVFMWVFGEQEVKTFSYDIIDDGWTLRVRYAPPDIFFNKRKLFPERRLQKEHRLWQGSFLNCMAEFTEENNLESVSQVIYQQEMKLPIQVHSHKEYDDVSYLEMDGLYVRNIMLQGTKVFGIDNNNVKEKSFYVESSDDELISDSDEELMDESSDDEDL